MASGGHHGQPKIKPALGNDPKCANAGKVRLLTEARRLSPETANGPNQEGQVTGI